MGGTRRVANDPGRKARILRAALDVIAERGVHKTTHRLIAERADVPLGSLTYHFDGIEAIFEQSFALLAEEMAGDYREALTAAADRPAACAAVADLICGPEYASPREMALLFEMYSFATFNSAVTDVMRAWLRASRASLSRHFPPDACRALDALIEGWSLHRIVEREPLDRAVVLAAVTAIADRLGASETP
ncbi:TetR/AcrR family transcriptional regulator [Actinocorallia sp. A-T 12471]|uniref:TetR/AcrR family transcriptional regulator n=1 Tax=Actinocorallia sp. A-T 12471 TaxID=3089813 RepID=UPI0029CE0A05|nr:TetR family transcriptional regulator [Actinocorallia sp. A-T 12471]MDX6741064.1 TetR family transcriptional regulator [Actinocorallia sp. A-T 12471]